MANPSASASFIAPVSWGLGDLIVSLPAVQALIETGGETYLVVRSAMQQGLAERIKGLSGAVQEDEFSSVLLKSGTNYINLRDHPIQTKYWWGGPEFEKDFPGFKINDILKVICRDFGIEADFERPVALDWKPRVDVQNRIVFVPGSDGEYKCWPNNYWLKLEQEFAQAGWQCLLIGQPEQSETVNSLIESNVPWVPTNTLEDALDVVSNAALVISVDTGLMHLAVQQSTRTIGLYRHDPIYFRDYSHALPLVAPPCAKECVDKSLAGRYETVTEFTGWKPTTWACAIPEAERCMSTILPETVFENALACLKETVPS